MFETSACVSKDCVRVFRGVIEYCKGCWYIISFALSNITYSNTTYSLSTYTPVDF